MIVGRYTRSPSLIVRGDHVSHRAPQAQVQPAEPTAGDPPQLELSPHARAALVAIVRLLARQAAEEDVRSQRG
jgi:hypothetical protein